MIFRFTTSTTDTKVQNQFCMKKRKRKINHKQSQTSHIRRNTWSKLNPVGQNLGTKPAPKIEKQNGKKRKNQQSHVNFEDCKNSHPCVNHRQNRKL